MTQSLFEIRDIYKSYTHEGADVAVLRGASFEVERGEGLAIMGPSGSGKSTLLHILGGLEPPSRGEVLCEGKELYALKSDDRARWRNRRLGFVFQFHHLLGEFSAVENVGLPLLIRGLAKKTALEKAAHLLQGFDLGHRLDHRPSALSGGERQRVALARALIGEPDVLLADEPTGSLDHEQGLRVLEYLFKSQQARAMTLVMVTHNAELAGRFKRVLRLEEGQLRAERG